MTTIKYVIESTIDGETRYYSSSEWHISAINATKWLSEDGAQVALEEKKRFDPKAYEFARVIPLFINHS